MHAPDELFRTTALGDPPAAAADARADDPVSRMTRAARARGWDPRELAPDIAARLGGGIMPEAWFPELRTPLAAALSASARRRLGDEILCWLLSGILCGEQAAQTVCGQLSARFANPAARAFAAQQAAEEARHVEVFARYIAARWGEPYAVGEAFGSFLRDLIDTPSVPAKIVGINLLVEGFAMGAFANLQRHTRDRALRALLKKVIADEATHHQFGLLWAEATSGRLTGAERASVGKTVAQGFRALYLNLVSIRQRRAVYAKVGLDWRTVSAEVRAQRSTPAAAPGLEENINPLTVLAQTLRRSGLVNEFSSPALERRLAEHLHA